MKPTAVCNRGEGFVTLRSTTDRPAEIRGALSVRGVDQVFKGDQNQAWDAVLANHCLSRAVGDDGVDVTLFIQDERLGTGDSRLAPRWRELGRQYVLTEDYYRGRSGAVWEHQDVSYGLFFTEAVSPEQFAACGLPLDRATALWSRHAAEIQADAAWLKAMAALGVSVVAPEIARPASDGATRLGPPVDPEVIAALAVNHAPDALLYALTKTDGLYGVVPVENENIVMSSIPAGAPQVRASAQRLLVRVAAAGAMRQAGSRVHRRHVKERARAVAEWAGEWLEANPGGSVADFQEAMGRWLTDLVFPADRVELDRASRFMAIRRGEEARLKTPSSTMHSLLDLAFREPEAFSGAYNDALNRVGFGLQRVRWEAETGRYTPPFFVEFARGESGQPVYRYSLEWVGADAGTLRMANPSVGTIEIGADARPGSAADLFRLLFSGLPEVGEIIIVGKAAVFAAEMQRASRGLGLPRQGSKYTPMVDHFVTELRRRGVLQSGTGLLIRIGLNTLDRLSAMADLELRLPRFLEAPLGSRLACRALAGGWRRAVDEARGSLDMLRAMEVGQHVHLARLLARKAGLPVPPGRAGRLETRLRARAASPAVWETFGSDFPAEAAQSAASLLRRREALLMRRPAAFTARREERLARELDRLPPLAPMARQEERERERIELQLFLLCAAYVRRLQQRAESLAYLNDRPYSLALYLLFGRDIFYPICREVEFDIEYVSPCPLEVGARGSMQTAPGRSA